VSSLNSNFGLSGGIDVISHTNPGMFLNSIKGNGILALFTELRKARHLNPCTSSYFPTRIHEN
jgi:hypothetical protein